MKLLLAGLTVGISATAFAAAPLTQSTFTEIIQDVKVVATANDVLKPARMGALFKAPDRVRTGPESRVELTAADQTITRIGANTIFAFEAGERTIRLEKGSVLFQSPAGQGGGTIKYRGTAAAVLGTTIVCTVLEDGSFKTLVLEGQATVTLADGRSATLNAGELMVVPADGKDFGSVVTFDLEGLVAHLQLINGFSRPLPSLPLIKAAIQQQQAAVAAGTLGPLTTWQKAGEGLELRAASVRVTSSPDLLNFIDHTQEPVSPSRP